jgi:hypothetical protein
MRVPTRGYHLYILDGMCGDDRLSNANFHRVVGSVATSSSFWAAYANG